MAMMPITGAERMGSSGTARVPADGAGGGAGGDAGV